MKAKVEKIYRLSNLEKGILYHNLENRDSKAYFEEVVMRITGSVDILLLERSFNEVVKRHEVLRSSYTDKADDLLHIILNERKIEFLHKDLRNMGEETRELQINEYLRDNEKRSFNLTKDMLIRAALFQTEESKYQLIISYHHIIIDGWSFGIIMGELLSIYSQLKKYGTYEGREAKAYSEYIHWMEKKDQKKALVYWEEYLSGYEDEVKIPELCQATKNRQYKRKQKDIELTKRLTDALIHLAKRNNVTLNIVLQCIWGVLLAKYNRTNDVVYGIVTSGRNAEIHHVEEMVGLFINTIPSRIRFDRKESFRELLRRTQSDFLESDIHCIVNLADIQAMTPLKRKLINHIMAFENYAVDNSLSNLNQEEIGFAIEKMDAQESTNYDFNIAAALNDQQTLAAKIIYNESVYAEETVNHIKNHMIRIMEQITEDETIGMSEIEIITEAEKNLIINEFNHTKLEYPKDNTVVELFAKQAVNNPKNIFAVFQDEIVTYQEAYERVCSFALLLREKGVTEEYIVGILSKPSIHMIISILAVLLAGGAYMPIDPEYPLDRIKFMIKDSKTKLLIAQDLNVEFKGEILNIEDSSLYDQKNQIVWPAVSPQCLAYVIYTSGTTGEPKGVMVEHKALLNLVHWHNNYYEVTQSDRSVKYAGIGFDASVWEIFPYLAAGATLYIMPEEIRLDLDRLHTFIEKNGITMAFLPTQICEQFMEKKNKSLRILLTGGDKLKKYKADRYRLFNNYGPTENTVVTTSCEILKAQANIPIGKPIGNTRIYILDEENHIVPVLVPGELCISGESLARGYLHDSELTEEKFTANPHEQNQNMYHTGDLVRWLPDGTIEFLGRIDQQVKINGVRIELGEIENALLNIEGIAEVVVLDHEINQSKYLCAYYVADKEYQVKEFRDSLALFLPDFMIPSYFVKISGIPLTPNGKIDKRRLPQPEHEIYTGAEFDRAGNELEEMLVQIWEDVLNVSNISINDHFFELGGHSLKATVLAGRIRKKLKVEVPVAKIFETGSVKKMGEYIQSLPTKEHEKISRIKEKSYYEVSYAQKRMFMLQEMDRQSTAYNMPAVLEAVGNLDMNRLTRSITEIMKRHEILRTRYFIEGDELFQQIQSFEEMNFSIENIFLQAGEDIEGKINEFIRPFSLTRGPIFRMAVLKASENRSILMFDIHHIASDGISLTILIKDLSRLYGKKELKELELQYKDYSAWQINNRNTDSFREQERYWLNEFGGGVPVLNLAPDKKRPKRKDYLGKSVKLVVDAGITDGLKKLAQAQGCTLYMVLLANLKILLSKYTGQEELVVGSPIAGRNQKELEDIIGMFVNTFAIRSTVGRELGFREFLQVIKEKTLKAYENQEYPFEELVEKLNLARDLSRNAIFDVMFIMQNMERSEFEMDDLSITPYSREGGMEKFDLTMTATEEKNTIAIELSYASSIYHEDTMKRMADNFVHILEAVLKSPETKIKDIQYLSPKEEKMLLEDFNGISIHYPREKTLHTLFEEQVQRTPEKIALIYADQGLTYEMLNRKADSLACVLMEEGVSTNVIVGVMVKRSLEMMIAILAILKAGGAYVPIDPQYPKERVDYILNHSAARLVLTHHNLQDKLSDDISWLDLLNEELYRRKMGNRRKAADGNDLAYVIYTSGSTGNPKGVMIRHRNAVNFITGICSIIDMNENKTILALTTICFDIFFLETLLPLTTGMKVIIASDEVQKDPNALSNFLLQNEIDMLQTTPSRIQLLFGSKTGLACLGNIKELLVGGEMLPESLCFELKKHKNLRLYNMYGPTETTVWSTAKDLTNEERITIGKPLANTRIYIMDQSNKLVPVGAAGELCIGGDGVSKGYLYNEILTAEKFIEDPFASGQTIYKTGDSARWLGNGNIEFLGRMDDQVKIRGFRIELGEIESVLIRMEGISEAVIIDRNRDDTKYLCAYYTSRNDYTVGNLREWLGNYLPAYMIPAYFIKLENIPLTPNGKVDRRSLPEPDYQPETGREYEAAGTVTEKKLTVIWKEILGLKKISINDNFFELGGHSLKATSLVNRIYKEQNLEVPLSKIFELGNIKRLGSYLDNLDSKTYVPITPIPKQVYYEASKAQKRMYLLQELELDSTAYNMVGAVEIEGALDLAKLQSVWWQVMERHEVLRTSFHLAEDRIVQKVHPMEEIDFHVERIMEHAVGDFVQPFRLGEAPLLRAAVMELSKGRHVLLFDTHHIIADGISMSILSGDFRALYEGIQLEPLKIQYKDFSAWQNKRWGQGACKAQEAYWLKEFEDEISALHMPLDYKRPSRQDFLGDKIEFSLDKDLTGSIKRIAKATGCTLYMMLLGGLNVLLSKYSGQEDIIVGSPVAGRNHQDLEDLIGIFINTLALRTNVSKEMKFSEYLKELKSKCLKAFENQEYPFEELVDKLDLNRDLSRNPLFDVMFLFQNADDADSEMKALSLNPYELSNPIEKFDLTVSAADHGDDITVRMSYAASLFKRETVERMGKNFIHILEAVEKDPNIKIGEIDPIDNEEKGKLLTVFNSTQVDYPDYRTVVDLFECQVQETPQDIALVMEDQKLTYCELNQKANSMAAVLKERGVGREHVVAIAAERSIAYVISILAVLKTGGAFLPIDPQYPEERVRYLLKDSNAKLLINSSGKNTDAMMLETLDLYDKKNFSPSGGNLVKNNHGTDLAYIIYTSGTTGKPKGVMIEHRALVNYILYAKERYLSQRGLSMPLYTSVAFDLTMTSIFTPLVSGNTIVIYKENEIVTLVNQVFAGKEVNVIKATPAHLSILKDISGLNPNIHKFIVGGEELTEKLAGEISDLFQNNVEIINEYGPTEATVGCIVHSYQRDYPYNRTLLIGKPINNMKVYILDENSRLLPIGVVGELCIGGDGLARGYQSKEEITAEKFIENPFQPGEKIYKTGDLARWLSDGNIEYLGRNDHQVKLRGYRIELGEIENNLLKISGIKDAVVILKNESTNQYLCAYYVSENDFTFKELNEYLKKELPHYMVPSYFMKLDSIPLTTNGKVDRGRLPNPQAIIDETTVIEKPKEGLEKQLAVIWEEILGVPGVSRNISFFEAGGHSLRATVLAARINKKLSVKILLSEIFQNPTIAEMAQLISTKRKSVYQSIKRIEKQDYYSVSASQRRFYIINELENADLSYHIPLILKISGKLNMERFQEAFNKLIQRHEALRTSFHMVEEKLVQKIEEEVKGNVRYHVCERSNIEEEIMELLTPFDLSKAPLIRAVMMRQNAETNILVFDIHHIISDGVSMEILMDDFMRLYYGEILKPLILQYKDYVYWQQGYFKGKEIMEQKQYWRTVFKDELPVLNMPTDFKRPKEKKSHGENYRFTADQKLVQQIKDMETVYGMTTYMVLLTGYTILLSKYTGQEDIIVGSPIAGRQREEFADMVGIFINTLAMRNRPAHNKSFTEFIREVRDNCLNAYENQDCAFDELVEELKFERDTSRNALFDTMLVLQNYESKQNECKTLGFSRYGRDMPISKFDLTLTATEGTDEIEFVITYASALFKRETIQRIASHFINILRNMGNKPAAPLGEIEMLTEYEKAHILKHSRGPQARWDQSKNLHEIFEHQVQRVPDQTAVVSEHERLTYRDLNCRANQLARVLLEKGVKHRDVVALKLEESVDILTAILAVWKVGAVYLPIDIGQTSHRIKMMLADSQAALLIINQDMPDKACNDQEILDLRKLHLEEYEGENLAGVSSVEDNVYLIYTSGSTGEPKGVLIKNSNLINYVNWFQNEAAIDQRDKTVLMSSYAFDLGYTAIYPALLSGGEVHIVKRDLYTNAKEMQAYIVDHQITYLKLTPTLFHIFTEQPEFQSGKVFCKVRLFVLGGEKINTDDVRQVLEAYPKATVMNHYGPTETTVGTVYQKITMSNFAEFEEHPVIGRPINNANAYILDRHQRIVADGIYGELCISGLGVANGYRNSQTPKQRNFMKNPFDPSDTLYRTGDIARRRANGTIEILGRNDQQIKIRGYRVEAEDIERQILKYKNLKEAAVVITMDQQGSQMLCAYYTADKEITFGELRDFLKDRVSDYMIPVYMKQIEKMPMLENGKINKKALPEVNFKLLQNQIFEGPRNEIERKILNIWEEILDVAQIGINDNFFALGGDSIKALQIISRMSNQGYQVTMKELFGYPQVNVLSKYVRIANQKIKNEIIEGVVALTPIQKAFFDSNKKEYNHYNHAVMLGRKEGFKRNEVEKIFEAIVTHHDALRMIFKMDQGDITQYNRGIQKKLVVIKEFDVRDFENQEAKVLSIAASLQKQINVTDGKLFQLALFYTEKGDHLLIILHHLITDGVSWRILLEDFREGFRQLPDKKVITFYSKTDSFLTYAAKLKEYAASETIRKEIKYWRRISGVRSNFLGKKQDEKELLYSNYGELDRSLTREKTQLLLRNTNHAYHTEINDILIAALAIAHQKLTGEHMLKIELESHGRAIQDLDLSRTIGWFTAKYPVVIDIEEEAAISDKIKSVKEILHNVPNRGIGYGLLRYLSGEEIFSCQEHPSILFNYLGQMNEEMSQEEFSVSDLPAGDGIGTEIVRSNPLEISAAVINHEMNIRMRFLKTCYAKQEISEFIEYFRNAIMDVVMHCAEREYSEKTPSDYGDGTLTIAELEEIKLKYRNCEIEKIYPLANMQSGMLFHSLEDRDSESYFEQMVLELSGEIDAGILEDSFHELMKRHEILRTSIEYEITPMPRNIIIKARKPEFYYRDLTKATKEKWESEMQRYMAWDRERGFDISKDTLMRIGFFQLGEKRNKLIWSSHHIIFDGWSRGILLTELFELYNSRLMGRSNQLAKANPYSDYVNWLSRQEKQAGLVFWKEYLKDYEEVTSIPVFSCDGKANHYQYKERTMELSPHATKALNEVAARNNVTLNTVVQLIWAIILGKYNNKDDVVFGQVVSGRNKKVDHIEQMVGLFINTIPVRCEMTKTQSFSEQLRKMQERAFQCNQYDYLSLSEIQAQSEQKHHLIDHIIVYENYAVEYGDGATADEKPGFEFEQMNGQEQNNYNFTIVVVPGKTLKLKFIYNGNKYEDIIIQNIEKHIKNVMRKVQENDGILLNEIDIVTEDEKKRNVTEFNDTNCKYETNQTISELFEEQVRKTPHQTAVSLDEDTLTYMQLNEKANQLADMLRQKGAITNTIVGIMMSPSLDMLVGILGILKAGGAYLPIAPDYPTERKSYMMTDCEVKLLLVNEPADMEIKGEIISLKDDMSRYRNQNLNPVSGPEDLVYVIYTSGSTGRPKGVMIKQKGLVNYIRWAAKTYAKDGNMDFPLYSSFSFDLTVTSIFTPIVTGSKIVVYKEKGDEPLIRRVLEDNKVGIVKLTPAHLSLIRDMNFENSKITRFIVGGENLKTRLAKEIYHNFHQKVSIYNEYGPTETVVGCMIHEYDDEKDRYASVPIGRPADNTQIYILDETLKVVPCGVKGEIYIGGDGLARGYLNKPDLTDLSFINHPFDKGKRLYRTGDQGRFLINGEIEYLGRNDDQVKVNGYRIEIGEIEDKLLQNSSIKEAVVALCEDRYQQKYLCAYVVNDEGKRDESEKEIQDQLRKILPEFMIPSRIMHLDSFQLTSNGKIDKSGLPNPGAGYSENHKYEKPQKEMEKTLVTLWEDILDRKKIGINDNLFELGMNSLHIITFVTELSSRLKYRIPFKDVFKYRTIKAFADFIENTNDILKDSIVDCIQLTDIGEETIFCFPPVASLAIGYMEFAKNLKGYTVYSFNFIKSESRLKKYVKTICSLNPRGPYILLGYSSGGNLAFDTAKELNRQGYEVKEVILLDSKYRETEQEHSLSEEEWKQKLYERLDPGQFQEAEGLVSEYSMDMIMSYLRYVDGTKTTGAVKGNISYISAERDWNEMGALKWERAGENFMIRQGFGTHYEMVTTKNSEMMKKNAELVIEILKQR